MTCLGTIPHIASLNIYFVVPLEILKETGILEATLNTSLSKNGTRSSIEFA